MHAGQHGLTLSSPDALRAHVYSSPGSAGRDEHERSSAAVMHFAIELPLHLRGRPIDPAVAAITLPSHVLAAVFAIPRLSITSWRPASLSSVVVIVASDWLSSRTPRPSTLRRHRGHRRCSLLPVFWHGRRPSLMTVKSERTQLFSFFPSLSFLFGSVIRGVSFSFSLFSFFHVTTTTITINYACA